MVRPSLEALAKRRGIVIIDAPSHEELGKTLASLPFWSRLTWNVEPLESYHSAIERDRRAMENLRAT